MYEFFCGILQTYYRECNLRLHYMETDSFIYSCNSKTGKIGGGLEDLQEKKISYTIFEN